MYKCLLNGNLYLPWMECKASKRQNEESILVYWVLFVKFDASNWLYDTYKGAHKHKFPIQTTHIGSYD